MGFLNNTQAKTEKITFSVFFTPPFVKRLVIKVTIKHRYTPFEMEKLP